MRAGYVYVVVAAMKRSQARAKLTTITSDRRDRMDRTISFEFLVTRKRTCRARLPLIDVFATALLYWPARARGRAFRWR